MRDHNLEMNAIASAAAMFCGLGSLLAAIPDSATILKHFAWDVTTDGMHVGLSSMLAADGNIITLEDSCKGAAGRALLLLCGGVAACAVSFTSHFARRSRYNDSPTRRQAAIASAGFSSFALAAATLVFGQGCVAPERGFSIGFGRWMAAVASLIQLFVTYSHACTPVVVSAVLPVLGEGLLYRKFTPANFRLSARRNTLRRVEETDAVESAPMPETVPTPETDTKPAENIFSPESLPGAIPPFGYFDPLGISDVPLGRSYSAEARLKYFREAELKHGRVAMLAALGFLVAEQFHPLFGGDIDVPSYIAFQQTPLQAFWPAVVAVIGAIEVSAIKKYKSPIEATWSLKDDAVPGDFGFDPLGLKPRTEKDLMNMQNKELSNGRLAMLAIAGMVGQELAYGQKLFGGSAAANLNADTVDPVKVAEIAKEMADVLNSTQ